ncbi:hypothetical protein BCR36DRAFT_588601 [Piromyces finnis]|uniref:Uncharacterized protein n=1 Tax=Piromyces finnis TaxID=1754191 RepID=A0A1Y1U7Q4_9FUNG|nr:hypothetical protein BCR36DRAFT_588601 [Piromyces finnis]|eukprot:ORX33537.1 hypothetical protein BCR36DRAFT_588601 [Piromyces finnis]
MQPLIIRDLVQGLESKCFTDENNELCPFSIYAITLTGEDEALSDTCKSKKCTESLIKSFKEINVDRFAAYENLSFTTEKSDKCKSSHETSDAGDYITTKITTVLLPLLILTLLLFLY